MKKAVIYARVSTNKQAEEGMSIDAQLKQLKEYAADNGYEIIKKYVDQGASAKTADRPAFQEMISDIKSNPDDYDAVLIHKTDRFARNREDSIVFKSLLRRDCDVDVIAIKEDFGDGPVGKMIEGILEVIAEFYSDNLSKEVLKGMQEKAERGEPLGELPLGYTSENNKIVAHEEEAPIIKYIFNQYKNGESMNAIYFDLAANGETMFGDIIHNRSKTENRTLPPKAIKVILTNEIYKGTYSWKDTIIEDNHEAIVSEEIFEIVQDRLNNNTIQRSDSKDYLLKGLVKCYECGGNMSQHTERYKKADGNIKIYRRLRCTNHIKMKNCYYNGNRMEEVNKELINYLENIANGNIDASQLDITQTGNNELADKLERLQNKYDSFDDKFDRQMEAFQAGIIDIDQLEKYKKQLQQEKEETEKEINQLQEKINDTGVDHNSFQSKVNRVVNVLEDDNVSLNKKKNILLTIISEIRLSKREGLMEIKFKM